MREKEKLLLHSCCGPCSTSVIERLTEEYHVTVFFYNPNITDADEYERRRLAQKTVIEKFADVLEVNAAYNPEYFLKKISGFEGEKEGGRRCDICFEMRLLETGKKAKEMGFNLFATTLTVSPHKSYEKISEIGKNIERLEGVRYLDGNFKKKGGFKRSIELSREMKIYRQDYCGCQFSKWR